MMNITVLVGVGIEIVSFYHLTLYFGVVVVICGSIGSSTDRVLSVVIIIIVAVDNGLNWG